MPSDSADVFNTTTNLPELSQRINRIRMFRSPNRQLILIMN
jgi:hypothetical protein